MSKEQNMVLLFFWMRFIVPKAQKQAFLFF